MKPGARRAVESSSLEKWRFAKSQNGLWRELGSAKVDPRKDLSSNDYLGLLQNQEFCESLKDISGKTQMGSGGSRLLGGNQPEHLALEKLFCEWKNAPAALCFASGFQANLSVFQMLAKVFDQPLVFSDARNHASMIDGMR